MLCLTLKDQEIVYVGTTSARVERVQGGMAAVVLQIPPGTAVEHLSVPDGGMGVIRARAPRVSLREGDVLVVGDARLFIRRIKGSYLRVVFDVPEQTEVRRVSVADAGEAPRPAAAPAPARQAERERRENPLPTWAVTVRRGSGHR